MNKIYRQNVLALMGIGDSHSLFIGKEGVIGLHEESAGAIIFVHHCAKVIVELTALNCCTEEVPIIVTQNDNQSFVRYMNPISNVFYRNFTLIKSNLLFPNVFQLGNGSWIAFGQILKIVEKPQVLSYLEEPKREVPIFKEVFDGLFTEKQLEDSRLAERHSRRHSLYRHSRRTITGREVFLGTNGKYTHEQLLHFNAYTSDLNWHDVPWIEPIKRNILTVWHLVRALTLTLMTIFLIAKILVICLRIILSTTLFLEGAQPRVALQSINPLIEPKYKTVLKNQQLKQKQVSKKFVKTKVSELSSTDKTDFEPGAVKQEKTNLFQLENFSTSIECLE